MDLHCMSEIEFLSMFVDDVCCDQLGGIVTPNDGHCHLDMHGMYTESLNQVPVIDCDTVLLLLLYTDVS